MTRNALAVLLFLPLCSGLAAQSSVRPVRGDGPPVWGDTPRLVEEVRIGTLEGDPEYAFGMVGGVLATTDGTILGTPSYMSPEHARGIEVVMRSDVWSFGCCLDEAMKCIIPFAV